MNNSNFDSIFSKRESKKKEYHTNFYESFHEIPLETYNTQTHVNHFIQTISSLDEPEDMFYPENEGFPNEDTKFECDTKDNNNYNNSKDCDTISTTIFLIVKKKRHKNKIHDKYSKDNQIRKLKTNCTKSIISTFNMLIKLHFKGKQKFLIRKVKADINKRSSKQFNHDMFLKKIGDLLKEDISVKYTAKEKDKNKKNIDLLLKIDNFKKLFDYQYMTFYKIFIGKLSLQNILIECGLNFPNINMQTLEDYLTVVPKKPSKNIKKPKFKDEQERQHFNIILKETANNLLQYLELN